MVGTVVGAGYAIAVCLPGNRGCGLVHLDSYMAEAAAGEGMIHGKASELLQSFLDDLATLGPLIGAKAEIIGGADVLKLMSNNSHELAVEGWVAALSEALLERGIVVRRVMVQGSATRRVSLTIPQGSIEIKSAGPVSHARATVVSGAASGSLAGEKPREGRAPGDITVNIGSMCVERSPCRLVTLLGSCVGVAIYDATTTIGGLAHVMLPRSNGSADQHSRFADTAVPALVAAMVSAGACRARFEAKIAGGATVLFGSEPSRFHRISQDNIALVREGLGEAGIPLLGEDVGGTVGRKMYVDLRNFSVRVVPLSKTKAG